MPFFVLAHGALGIFDELIFIGVAVLFLITMIIVWVRSRAIPPTIDETPTPDAQLTDDTHFRLD
ncbi:MAG TPA: hypothetical protein PLZ51_18560 [Aggregatilineales bacterium]|nr:hypothetical protein [Aggregatilineales bacterium]